MQYNKEIDFHKGRQRKGQMPIMLATYSMATSRLTVTKTIC